MCKCFFFFPSTHQTWWEELEILVRYWLYTVQHNFSLILLNFYVFHVLLLLSWVDTDEISVSKTVWLVQWTSWQELCAWMYVNVYAIIKISHILSVYPCFSFWVWPGSRQRPLSCHCHWFWSRSWHNFLSLFSFGGGFCGNTANRGATGNQACWQQGDPHPPGTDTKRQRRERRGSANSTFITHHEKVSM